MMPQMNMSIPVFNWVNWKMVLIGVKTMAIRTKTAAIDIQKSVLPGLLL